jgi:P-type conjugative transfer ATPase TrbB
LNNTLEVKRRLNEKLRRELGDIILNALSDPSVVEVMLNPDGCLWIDRLRLGMTKVGRMEAVQAENLICTIASMLGTEATREKPIVEGELPIDGSRFEGILPPLVESPSFAIRKRAEMIYTLEDYVKDGIMSPSQCEALTAAISARQNILVVGATGSGKTTLCNALLQAISEKDPSTRIAIIEDTRELQCPAVNKVPLRTSENIGMTQLLRACMRMRPDRIVVGEVRGAEALALIKAWNTGHPGGVATIHANDVVSGLLRIEQLIQEANVPPIPQIIAEAVNVVVSIQRKSHGRRVEEIAVIKGYQNSSYVLSVS